MRDAAADLLHQAKQAIKAKQKPQARRLLQQAIQTNPGDYRAWAWMAALAPTPNSGMDYIRQAEKLAPDDPFVQKIKGWLNKQIRPSPPSEPASEPAPLPASGRQSWQTAVIWGSIVILIILVLGLGSLALWGWLSAPKEVMADTAVLRQSESNSPNEASLNPPEILETPKPPTAGDATPLPGIPAKNIAASHSEKNPPRPTWTPTPTPTNTPIPSPTPVPTFISPNNEKPASRPFGVGPNEHWVDVDLTTQTLVAYEGST
ncbi:MAG: tetratricopeptide repeat protein, partial [Anaerolineae bacterium]